MFIFRYIYQPQNSWNIYTKIYWTHKAIAVISHRNKGKDKRLKKLYFIPNDNDLKHFLYLLAVWLVGLESEFIYYTQI